MAASRPPLLLLHGALGSGVQLEPLAQALDPHFETHIHEFPGHGARTAVSEWTLRTLAEDVLSHWSGSMFVVGYSMGGYVGLMAEHLHPGFLRGLVTLGTKFDWSPESGAREIKKLDADFLRAKAPEFVDDLIRMHGADRWSALLTETAGMMRDLVEGGALSPAQLQHIECRVHLCRAADDRMVTRTETEAVAEALLKATFLELPGAHGLNTVEVGVLAEAVKQAFMGQDRFPNP